MKTLQSKATAGASPSAVGRALLSLEESRHLAKPLRFRNQAERELVRETFQKAYSEWLADWSLPSVDVGNQGVRLVDVVEDAALNDAQAAELTHIVLFGERITRPDLHSRPSNGWAMSDGLASEAWDAWNATLLPFLEGSNRAPVPHGQIDPWSGGLYVAFPWAHSDWILFLNALQVDRLLGRRRAPPVPHPQPARGSTGLVPLSRAINGHTLTVRIELGALTLSLGQLWSLSAGDVVILEHALDTPAAMHLVSEDEDNASRNARSEPLCASWLGQSAGQMAVELFPLS